MFKTSISLPVLWFIHPNDPNTDAEPLKINESTSLGTQFTKQRNAAAILPTYDAHIEIIWKE